METIIKDTRHKINTLIQEKPEKHWEKTLRKIDHRQPEKFFPIINEIFRPKQLIEPPAILISENEAEILKNSKIDKSKCTKTDNNLFITELDDKTNILGAYFESINTPKNLNATTRIKSLIDNEINMDKTTFASRYNKPVTNFTENNKANWPNHISKSPKYFCNTAGVKSIFNKLPNKTSTGHDEIPAVVLKHLPQEYTRNYTILFNNALNLQYFLKRRKNTKIIPIHKKGKEPNRPSSYRPISHTPNISKVYEAISNNRIVDHCNINGINPNNQYGFRANHSTTHTINRLLSVTHIYLNQDKIIGATLIDLEKAFDSIWISGLMFKLKRKKFNQNLINII